jgi:cystathionine beta-lyase/cystathionine gamma-synthase
VPLLFSEERIVALTLFSTLSQYGGMHRLLTQVRGADRVHFVDTTSLDKVRLAFQEHPKTRLLHVESPSNPLMRISDIRGLAEICREFGVFLSVDSTMMSPYLMKPLALGADLVIHSATKFLSGHSDTMGGIVATKSADLAKRVAFLQVTFFLSSILLSCSCKCLLLTSSFIRTPRGQRWLHLIAGCCCVPSKPSQFGWNARRRMR